MGYILHIDTSGNMGSIFLSKNGEIHAVFEIKDAHGQSAVINKAIDFVIQKSKIHLNDLSAISVCNGPGSYTGLRVGLSTAKGICFALDKPLILQNKLSMAVNEFALEDDHVLIAFIARKGEYFVAGNQLQPQHLFFEDLQNTIKALAINKIVTDDEELKIENCSLELLVNYIPNKNNWAKRANELFFEKKFDDIAYSEPFYLKQAFTTQAKNNILHP